MAVLDPSTFDLLEDPWHKGQVPKQYLRPIAVPFEPVALSVGLPPLYAPSTATVGYENTPYMYLTAAGNRLTTGVLLIPSSDGHAYFADLARWELPSDTFELYFGYGQETFVSAFRPSDTDLPEIRVLRPPDAVDGPEREVHRIQHLLHHRHRRRLHPVDAGLYPQRRVDRGLPGETFRPSPSRTCRPSRFASGSGPATQYRVALQSSLGTQVVNLYDPAYGLRTGDIVDFWTSLVLPAGGVCADTPSSTAALPIAPIEGKILEIDKPDTQHPGGSLLVTIGDCPPVLVGDRTVQDCAAHGPYTTFPACWESLGGNPVPVSIRAQGGASGKEEFVVSGLSTGYAGRATTVASEAGFPQFSFTNDGEGALVGVLPATHSLSVGRGQVCVHQLRRRLPAQLREGGHRTKGPQKPPHLRHVLRE